MLVAYLRNEHFKFMRTFVLMSREMLHSIFQQQCSMLLFWIKVRSLVSDSSLMGDVKCADDSS